MSSVTFPVKDPDEVLDYCIDWTAALGTDTIQTSTWTMPSGLNKVSDALTTTHTTIVLSGGTLGVHYSMNNRIETVGNKIHDRTATIWIRGK